MSDEEEMKALVEALKRLISVITGEPLEPEHRIKRELERWFRDKGYSKSQAVRAVSRAFEALRTE